MSHAKKMLYLAGPITGCTYNDARYGWRKTFADALQTRMAERGTNHLECFSPMREKEFLEKEQCIDGSADYESLHGFGTPQGILTRDHNDVRTCDAMIACFLGATKVSIGTCVEFGFAHSYRKPLIMVMEAPYTVTDPETTETLLLDRVEADRRYRANTLGEIVTQTFDNESGKMKLLVLKPSKTRIVKNVHDHTFLRACAGYCVPTLEHAADIAYSILTPGM